MKQTTDYRPLTTDLCKLRIQEQDGSAPTERPKIEDEDENEDEED